MGVFLTSMFLLSLNIAPFFAVTFNTTGNVPLVLKVRSAVVRDVRLLVAEPPGWNELLANFSWYILYAE